MPRGRPLDVEQEIIEAFRHSGLVSEHLLACVPARYWRMNPPSGRGRTIAAIVAHMQGIRRTFARLGGVPEPAILDKDTVTPAQARRALRASTRDLARLFQKAIDSGHARVPGMPRRMVDMLTYLIQHDAHHRGQICTLASDLGHRFRQDDLMRFWGWKRIGSVETKGRVRRRTA
jgi:uncharacterized damage-inducible protein DinB